MFAALGQEALMRLYFTYFTTMLLSKPFVLGAGSIIHGLEGEQDREENGWSQNSMPLTYYTF